jgi:phage-related holin
VLSIFEENMQIRLILTKMKHFCSFEEISIFKNCSHYGLKVEAVRSDFERGPPDNHPSKV